MERKHLSPIANDVLRRCAENLDTSVDALVQDFEAGLKPELSGYSRKLLEFCSSKALVNMCCGSVEEQISNGTFTRLTFDMMLAWEKPSPDDDSSHMECEAKGREDTVLPKAIQEQDDVSLFYSDLMPLLVDNEPSVGEDAFVWLGTLVPLAADVVNRRFTFETVTTPTGNRLHFPAYDRFLKEIDKCVKHLQKQLTPTGMVLADDEFILHVEGTASTQRVVRHIGGTSWPGRLTLTNYALYFEATGVISYEKALKVDLSKAIDQNVKPAATGPWGAPLFDKAILYESFELEEGLVLEFPEMTSSTRRDHWLALVKEIILLHQFLSKFKLEPAVQEWEMHSRTILGIIRLHAAREMLRISPPVPKYFLIFTLLDELPRGDYVLEELAQSLKNVSSCHPCSASSILRNLNVARACIPCVETEEAGKESKHSQAETLTLLENTIDQAREEEKEIETAKASAQSLKDEGISDTALVLMELVKPVKNVWPWVQDVLTWKRPAITISIVSTALVIVYKEWFGKVVSGFLFWVVARMLQTRYQGTDRPAKIVVSTASDQTTMESIVSVQHGLRTAHDMLQLANIAILKLYSILISKAPKHANMVMMTMTGAAIVLAVVPLKFIVMALLLYCSLATSKLGKLLANDQGNRRLKEWWYSIPVLPVETVDKVPIPR